MVFTDPKGGRETTIKVYEMKGKGPQRHQGKKGGWFGVNDSKILVHVSKFDAESTACHEDARDKWAELKGDMKLQKG